MTSEQFFELPEPTGGFTYELQFGELVEVGRAKKKHFDLQTHTRDVLVKALGRERWLCEIEMPYGLTAGYDARAADRGVVLRSIWEAIPPDEFLIGSPALVVQVKSRSKRDRKMEEDAILHITHGAAAVWIAKPDRHEIVVVTASSRTAYGPGQRIELAAPFSTGIAVDEVFPG